MGKMALDRSELDHPEHFDDIIREYRDSSRYRPTPLEQLLFELAGHRCTICHAPWLEIHHIVELEHGGETTYENLIVLCPNCHTRVHRDGIPTAEELRHYKLKQEVAYELPVLSRLTLTEKSLIFELAALQSGERVLFSKGIHREIAAATQDAAVLKARTEFGCRELQESGMLLVDQGFCVTLDSGELVSVILNVRFSGKGVKWVGLLEATGRLPTPPPGSA